MLKSYNFILLSVISFNSICYGMESSVVLSNENSKILNNKQIKSNDRSKSLNNYPEKRLFFKNVITNNGNDINNNCNNNSNNKSDNLWWENFKELVDENNDLKEQVEFLKEENNDLKIQNEQVQQKIKELTMLVKELQKQIKNNNSKQTEDNTQNNECDNTTVADVYTQCTNLQQYNNLLLNLINNITNQLSNLEAENARKDDKIKRKDRKIGYRESEIKYLKDKNRRLYLNLKSARMRSNSISANTSYSNLSLYSNYKSYRNINYNNKQNSRKHYSAQKEFRTYNQLLDQQIKDLKNENNEHVNNNQSKNNKLGYQISKNQNSAINIVNNINYSRKKNIIKIEEEEKQIFGKKISLNNNDIETTNNIVGLGEQQHKTKNKKHKKKKKNKQKSNNINIININETNVKEEKYSIDNIDKGENIEIQNQILENNNINNEEHNKEDIKEDIKDEDKKEDIKTNEKINIANEYNYPEIKNNLKNINILKNGLTNCNNLNNDICLSNGINNIGDNLTTITEQDDNYTVITDYTETRNRRKNKNRKIAKQKKDEQFYKAFEEYEDSNNTNNIDNKNEDVNKNEDIIEKFILKGEQIVKIGNYNFDIEYRRNTDKNYLDILDRNSKMLLPYCSTNFRYKKDLSMYDKSYYFSTIYKVIEAQMYNDILHNNKALNKLNLLSFIKKDQVIKMREYNDGKTKNVLGLMNNKLYFDAIKNNLFINNGINFDQKIKNMLSRENDRLIEFFRPLITHTEKVAEILDNWKKEIMNNNNETDSSKKYSLMEKYLEYFLTRIAKEVACENIAKKQNQKIHYEEIRNIFIDQIVQIINIIRNSKPDDYNQLIHQLSNTVEDKLASQKYFAFYDISKFDNIEVNIDKVILSSCLYEISMKNNICNLNKQKYVINKYAKIIGLSI